MIGFGGVKVNLNLGWLFGDKVRLSDNLVAVTETGKSTLVFVDDGVKLNQGNYCASRFQRNFKERH